MAYFPTYFPGTYFGEGYWRGITGGTSLEGSGTGTATGGATLYDEAKGGGGFREYQRRVRQLLYIAPRMDDPLPLIGGGKTQTTGGAAITLATAVIGAGVAPAGGNAVLTMGHDFTEQDNAFWALAA
jgi:hypothetical protein